MSESLSRWLSDLAADTTAPASAKVARVLAQQPERASYGSISDISRLAGVNEPTVTRSAQGWGFSGWPALRAELRARFLASLSLAEVGGRHAAASPADDIVSRSLAADQRALALASAEFPRDLVAELAAGLAAARSRVAVGAGGYGAVAQLMAAHCTVIGFPIAACSDVGSVAAAVAGLGPGDVLVAFDFWRGYRDTARATLAAAERGATVYIVTDHAAAEFAGSGRRLLLVPGEGAGPLPTMVGALAVVNAVVNALAEAHPDRVRDQVAAVEATWDRMGASRRAT